MSPKNYSIFKLPNYLIKKNEEGIFNCKTFNEPIEQILKKLEKDKGYHIRISGNEPCILFGDLDHIPTEATFNDFIELLMKVFDIEKDKIKYTLSIKQNEYSYHWSVPSIEATPKIIKQKLEKKTFDPFRAFIDVSIYKKHWFRLPNQTNTEKPLTHNIIKGEMKDFIIHYVDNCEEDITEEQPTEEQPTEEQPTEQKTINKEQSTEQPEKEFKLKLKKGKTKEEYIEKLIDILDDSRADDNKEWFEVSCIINNELSTDKDNALKVFETFCKRSDKFNKNKDIKWFQCLSIKKDGLRIGSLIDKVKEDNITEYEILKSEFIKEDKKQKENIFKGEIPSYYFLNFNVKEGINSNDIAVHFKSLYENKFIYQKNKLYFFTGVYWKAEEKGELIALNNFISNVYYNDISKLFQNYFNEINDCNTITVETKVKINADIIKFQKSLLDLLQYDRRQKYINDILCKLHNDEIKFDENPYLFAFNNKVYDLKEGSFIEPKPEQYISITTGYNFIEQDDQNKLIDELDNIINTMFYQPELKKLYLTILSTGLDGIPLEKFILANGSGGNGKGVINELVQEMLGNYSYVLPVNILLGPLKTGSNPELANMNNKRLVIAREPDRNLKFNCATIKEITGGSELNARLNHSNETKVNLKLTFLLECNDKPQLNEVNDALARRILDIPFKSRFVNSDVYEELEENEKINTFLINDFYKTSEFKQKFKQAFFLILAKHYKEFNNNKRALPITAEIRTRNNEYLAKSDEFLSWFNNEFEKTKNKTDTIKLKIIYDSFKNSDFFTNMNKVQKRQNNYQNFIEKIQSNMFLKKFLIQTTKDKIYIMSNHIIKSNKNNDDDETDDEL